MRKITVYVFAIIALACIMLLPNNAKAQADNDTIKLSRYIYPSVITPGSTVSVTLVLFKGYRGGSAKLLEYIPKGFKVSAGDKNGANFTTTDTTANFDWGSMPEDPTFTFSYHLTVPKDALGDYSLSAEFTCLTHDGTATTLFKPFTIVVQKIEPKQKPTVAKIEKITPAVKPAPVVAPIVKSAPAVDTIQKPAPVVAPVVQNNPAPPPPVNKSDSALQKLIASNNALIAAKPATAANPVTAATTKSNSSPAPAQPIKVNGDLICFRVQIMATSQHLVVDSVILNSIRDRVYTNVFNGIYRFSVGQFNDVNDAIGYREKIKNVGLPGPFIVAYKNDTRITIKEAKALLSVTASKPSGGTTP